MYYLNLPAMVDQLARQELMVGAFLMIVGLMFMIMGLRLSRLVIAMSYGVIGFVLGGSLPGQVEARVAIGLIIALGLAGASLWLVRPAVAVLVGLWAGLVAAVLLNKLGLEDQVALVAAVVVFLGAGSLAFVTLQEVVAALTSFEGTLLFVAGFIILLTQSPIVWTHMRSLFVGNAVFTPFLLLSGTIIGFYTQVAELQKKQTGRSA